jgi:hypothetical protein
VGGGQLAGLRSVGEPGADRVEVDVDAARQQRRLVEQPLRLEPALPERPSMIPVKSQLAELNRIG